VVEITYISTHQYFTTRLQTTQDDIHASTSTPAMPSTDKWLYRSELAGHWHTTVCNIS